MSKMHVPKCQKKKKESFQDNHERRALELLLGASIRVCPVGVYLLLLSEWKEGIVF